MLYWVAGLCHFSPEVQTGKVLMAELVHPLPWTMQWAASSDRFFFTVCSVSHLGEVLKLPLNCTQVLVAVSNQRLKLTATLGIWNGHHLPLSKAEKMHPGGWCQLLSQQQNWGEPSSSPWFTQSGLSTLTWRCFCLYWLDKRILNLIYSETNVTR